MFFEGSRTRLSFSSSLRRFLYFEFFDKGIQRDFLSRETDECPRAQVIEDAEEKFLSSKRQKSAVLTKVLTTLIRSSTEFAAKISLMLQNISASVRDSQRRKRRSCRDDRVSLLSSRVLDLSFGSQVDSKTCFKIDCESKEEKSAKAW